MNKSQIATTKKRIKELYKEQLNLNNQQIKINLELDSLTKKLNQY